MSQMVRRKVTAFCPVCHTLYLHNVVVDDPSAIECVDCSARQKVAWPSAAPPRASGV